MKTTFETKEGAVLEVELHNNNLGENLSVKLNGEYLFSVNPKDKTMLVNTKTLLCLSDFTGTLL